MNKKPCTWNGIQYESVRAAARANFMSEDGMHYRLRRGYTCDEDLYSRRAGDTCIWNGKRYRSVAAAARANGITKVAMWYRLQSGYTCDDDITGNGAKTA